MSKEYKSKNVLKQVKLYHHPDCRVSECSNFSKKKALPLSAIRKVVLEVRGRTTGEADIMTEALDKKKKKKNSFLTVHELIIHSKLPSYSFQYQPLTLRTTVLAL